MIVKDILQEIEVTLNQLGLPALCLEGSFDELKRPEGTEKPDVFLKLVFETGQDESMFRVVNQSKTRILEILDGKSFFIKPMTFHAYLINNLLKEVCPDYDQYYFSPGKSKLTLRTDNGSNILDAEVKLLLITRGNVPDNNVVFDILRTVISDFNLFSQFIKINKAFVGVKESPFSLSGESEPTFAELTL